MRDRRGRFLPGPDPDRHQFTPEECSKGFWSMIASIAERYPDAYHSFTGTHMTINALPALIQRKQQHQG